MTLTVTVVDADGEVTVRVIDAGTFEEAVADARRVLAGAAPPTQAVRVADEDRERGIVKYWNAAKGYGFIAADCGGEDLFMHASNCPGHDLFRISAGDRVTYTTMRVDGRLKARDVRIAPATEAAAA